MFCFCSQLRKVRFSFLILSFASSLVFTSEDEEEDEDEVVMGVKEGVEVERGNGLNAGEGSMDILFSSKPVLAAFPSFEGFT